MKRVETSRNDTKMGCKIRGFKALMFWYALVSGSGVGCHNVERGEIS